MNLRTHPVAYPTRSGLVEGTWREQTPTRPSRRVCRLPRAPLSGGRPVGDSPGRWGPRRGPSGASSSSRPWCGPGIRRSSEPRSTPAATRASTRSSSSAPSTSPSSPATTPGSGSTTPGPRSSTCSPRARWSSTTSCMSRRRTTTRRSSASPSTRSPCWCSPGGALGRLARSRWVGTVAVAAGFLFMSAFPWLSSVWFPYLYAPAFLAFTVAAALVAAGRTPGAPPGGARAAGSSCTGTCRSSSSSGSRPWSRWSPGGWPTDRHVREEARRSRLPLLVSLGVVALFLVPLVLQTVRNFPGPWPAYLDFGSTGERDPRSVGDAFAFVLKYWTETPWPVWLYVVAAVVLVVVAAVTRDGRTSAGLRLAARFGRAADRPGRRLRLQGRRPARPAVHRGVLQDRPAGRGARRRDGGGVAAGARSATPALRVRSVSVAALAAAVMVVVAAQAPAMAYLPAGRPHLPGGRRRASGRPVPGRRSGSGSSTPYLPSGPGSPAWPCSWTGWVVPWCVGPDSEQVALLYTPQNVCREGDPVWNVTASMEPPPSGTTDLERGDRLRSDVALPLA